jgi:hypothetical protein
LKKAKIEQERLEKEERARKYVKDRLLAFIKGYKVRRIIKNHK